MKNKVISSEQVYKGSIFNIRKDKVEINKNKTSSLDVLEHQGAAAVVAINEDNKIVLVKQYRHAIERETIEIPAGKIDDNEEPMDTAIRELKEETGYEIDNIEFLCELLPALGYSNERIFIYLARVKNKGIQNLDFGEDIELMEVDLPTVISMINENIIKDSKTQVGLLLAERKLKCI